MLLSTIMQPGPSWQAKSLPFEVRVHSPYRSGDHVIYCITSTFTGESEDEGPGQTPEMTVHRRYSHFFSLAKLLEARYRALVLPPFPPKTYTGRCVLFTGYFHGDRTRPECGLALMRYF